MEIRKLKKLFLVMSCIAALMMAGCANTGDASPAQPSVLAESGASAESGTAGQPSVLAESGTSAESGTAGQPASGEPAEAAAESSKDILQADALKVGKADAHILRCGGQTMVIDCGEDEDGEEVLDFLKNKGVKKIDVLLITHFDKDHVGGADEVVDGIEVERVMVPAYAGTNTQYEDFIKALENADIAAEGVVKTTNLNLGPASVTVEPPASYDIPDGDEEYDNNFSLITTFEFGSRRMVFTGDIEKERIQEWLAGGTAQKCDLLKVPHHGKYTSALKELFETLQPEYAVICDSEKNPAADKTLKLLDKWGAQCFETKDGDISIECDGENIKVTQ